MIANRKVCISFLLIVLFNTFTNCSSGGEVLQSDDIIIGEWKLSSQLVNGTESITTCTEQINFTFEANNIRTKEFYREVNGNCQFLQNQIFSWQVLNPSQYSLTTPSGQNSIVNFLFSDNDTKFSITEQVNNDEIVSVFEKQP